MYDMWVHVCTMYLRPEYRALVLRGFLVHCHDTGLCSWSTTAGSSDRIRMIDLQPLLPPPNGPANLPLVLAIPNLGGAAPCNPAISIKIRGCTSTTKPSKPGAQKWTTAYNRTQNHHQRQRSAARRPGGFSGPAVGMEPVWVCGCVDACLSLHVLIFPPFTLICPRGAEPCTHAPNIGITVSPRDLHSRSSHARASPDSRGGPVTTRESKSRLTHCSITETTERICFTTRPSCCQSLPSAARPAQE